MRRSRDSDLRVKGLGLRWRMVLLLTCALAPILLVAGFLIYGGATRIAEGLRRNTISQAVRFTQDDRPYFEQPGGYRDANGVQVKPFTYGPGKDKEGTLYRFQKPNPLPGEEPFVLYVPRGTSVGDDMLGMIVGIFATVLIAAAAAVRWGASQVSRPIYRLIDDVRQIAKGDLSHRTHAVGAGEIELLARSIDRMTRELGEAQDAQVELSVRERELGVAAGVREALLPLATPLLEGYDLGAAFLSSTRFGGDFHDFIERPDGRVGLLVCGVSGRGVPAALVGATARSYLRAELLRSEDTAESLKRINRWLAGDVRRGMFVTALYCLVDHEGGRAQVACAGHKIPLLRYAAEDESLRVVHPEGIALGFDKGPVFERRLEIVETPIEPGDRLVLANSAPLALQNPAGQELGEKNFYARVKKHSPGDTRTFLKALRRDLERYTGEDEVQEDVSLVTIARERG